MSFLDIENHYAHWGQWVFGHWGKWDCNAAITRVNEDYLSSAMVYVCATGTN